MDKKLTFKYDPEADILVIHKRPPYAEQESEDIADGVIANFNPDTNEIESLEILFFSKRFQDKKYFELPITADFLHQR
jgi:uncharacterized protein YuzE